jgi:hypothetical protein
MFGEFAAKDVILKRVHESLAQCGPVVRMTHHRFSFDSSPMLAYQGFALYNCRGLILITTGT